MKFELPYNFNFDNEYFERLKEVDKNFIETIYLPIYSKIGKFINTRENIIHFPSSLEEYEEHIHLLQKENIPLTFLIQRFCSKEIVEEYMFKYNENRFIINDDNLAKELKDKYNDKIILTLSITRNLTYEDILNKDLSIYDYICLPFYFPHHLQLIKKLPKKYKYIIISNSICLTNCNNPQNHWFNLDNNFYQGCIYLKLNGLRINMKNSSFIRPEDTYLFENYINIFKIEGREKSSNNIFNDIDAYINKESYDYMRVCNFNYKDIESNYCQKID